MGNSNLPLGWRPALDGLRGVAVVAVVLFHFKTNPYLRGGWIGVDLFFGLSGFLITTLLLEEWMASGRIALGKFYARRLLRLFPAFAVLILTVAVVRTVWQDATFTRDPSFGDTLENVIFAAAYVHNWGMAFNVLDGAHFGHLWSLAVEEQYYLLWPGALILMLRAGLPLRTIAAVTLCLAAVSASVPFLLPDAGWRRLYYGTDYRIHGLLIGSVAGILFASGLIQRPHTRHPLFLGSLAIASLYMCGLIFLTTTKASFLLVFGFPLLAVSCAVVVLAVAFAEGPITLAVLGNRVLVYLGRRSYAIYLWHLPMGQWFSALDTVPHLLVAGTATLLAAELSHRVVERPALSLKRRFRAHNRVEELDAPPHQAAMTIVPEPAPTSAAA